MPSRKLYANSFLLARTTVVSCRGGNYMRKVSCRQEPPWCHVEEETICEKFPAGKRHSGVMSSRKPYAKSFLPVRNSIGVTFNRKLYAKSFLSVRNSIGVMPSRKLYAKSFLSVRNSIGVTLNRKPYAKSFLPARDTAASCRVGNHMRKVSCRQETHWSHAQEETIRE